MQIHVLKWLEGAGQGQGNSQVTPLYSDYGGYGFRTCPCRPAGIVGLSSRTTQPIRADGEGENGNQSKNYLHFSRHAFSLIFRKSGRISGFSVYGKK